MTTSSNFFLSLLETMQREPGRVCIQLSESVSITYGEVNDRSAKLANRLTALGLQIGDRVTAQVHKHEEVIILYLACLRGGFVFHPLNTAYILAELDYFVQDAKPALVVCDPSRYEGTKSLCNKYQVEHLLTLDHRGEGTLVDSLEKFSSVHSVVDRQSDDTAILIYTSGTTGKPKGAMISHQNIHSNVISLNRIWGFSSSDVLLHVLPLFHVHGLCVALHCAMLSSSRMIFCRKFVVERTVELIPSASVLMGVPTVYSRLLKDERLTPELCGNTRLFISGSAPLQPEIFDAFNERTGHRILERYGMTEAGMIASNPLAGNRVRWDGRTSVT